MNLSKRTCSLTQPSAYLRHGCWPGMAVHGASGAWCGDRRRRNCGGALPHRLHPYPPASLPTFRAGGRACATGDGRSAGGRRAGEQGRRDAYFTPLLPAAFCLHFNTFHHHFCTPACCHTPASCTSTSSCTACMPLPSMPCLLLFLTHSCHSSTASSSPG